MDTLIEGGKLGRAGAFRRNPVSSQMHELNMAGPFYPSLFSIALELRCMIHGRTWSTNLDFEEFYELYCNF